jgi:hypothetical protein
MPTGHTPQKFKETEEQKEVRKKYWREYAIKDNRKRNALCNNGEEGIDKVFTTAEPYIHLQEQPLRNVNEITTEGYGDMTIEFYEDGRTVILTSIPSTLKRVFWNRLNVNYVPSVSISVSKDDTGSYYHDKHGNIRLNLYDSNFHLWRDKQWSRRIIPGNLTMDQIEKEKENFMEEYVVWRYGSNDTKMYKWVVRGEGGEKGKAVHIQFINKHNMGQLVIYNRSFHTRVVTTSNCSKVVVPPYHKYNASKNRCTSCGV